MKRAHVITLLFTLALLAPPAALAQIDPRGGYSRLGVGVRGAMKKAGKGSSKNTAAQNGERQRPTPKRSRGKRRARHRG